MAGDTREGTISLPIEGGTLERFEAREALNELFTIVADVVFPTSDIDFFPHLGKPASIRVTNDGEVANWFHGLIFDVSFQEEVTAGYRYRLVLRPWLFKLAHNRDYAIYQGKTAVEVIQATFQRRSGSEVRYAIRHEVYKQREYCVQYKESDFNFVSRLMEEEGIHYYFEHSESGHVMVVCDDFNGHAALSQSINVVNAGQGRQTQDDHFWRFVERVGTTSEAQVRLRNFDFKRPDTPREGSYAGGEHIASETSEVYSYPAQFLEPPDGGALSQVILESAQRGRRVYAAEGNVLQMRIGSVFTINEHQIERFQGKQFVTVSQTYVLEAQALRSAGPGGTPTYVVLEAVPQADPWRPAIVTPRPRTHGPDTAVVTGPPGETIYTDEYGRARVRFHWDRSGSKDDVSTCWIRVSHNSADAGFGNIILPRIGQEVIVDFLDGDPDRPVITGRVYNNSHMQTYKLPDNKTRSVWRSQTIGDQGSYDEAEEPPSGPPGFNEIRMEDKGGQEEVFFHAQRDYKGWVRLDSDTKVGRDHADRIGRNRATHVKKDETLIVETGDELHQVNEGSRTSKVQKDDTLTVVAGDYSMSVQAGKATLEAVTSIELKVGQTSIKLTPSSIEMSALTITVEAKTALSLKGDLTSELKAGLTLTLNGGMVMIN